MSQRKKAKENPDIKSQGQNEIEKEEFKVAVEKRMLLTSRNTSPKGYRKYAFTPESALSALPSLQIKTLNPSEKISDGIVKYKKHSRNRVFLRSDIKTTKIDSNLNSEE